MDARYGPPRTARARMAVHGKQALAVVVERFMINARMVGAETNKAGNGGGAIVSLAGAANHGVAFPLTRLAVWARCCAFM